MLKISDTYGTDESSDMLRGYWQPRGEYSDERHAKIRSVMDRCGISVYPVAFLISAKNLGAERRKVLLNLIA